MMEKGFDYNKKEDVPLVIDKEVKLDIDLPAKLENLPELLKLFDEYNKKPNLGHFKEENPALTGGRTKVYYPSKEELTLSAIGDNIAGIVDSTDKEKLEEFLKNNNITREKIDYMKIGYETKDVMGSGRVKYPTEPFVVIVSFKDKTVDMKIKE
ncbi:hypothetical protein ACFLZN_01870 [Nanoarchaeota archaeon]